MSRLDTLRAALPPHIPLLHPATPAFAAARRCYVARPGVAPLAVARPASPADVAAVVRACAASGVPFAVRGGGHDADARCQVDGALMLDMRGVGHVEVEEAEGGMMRRARVGGGVLMGELCRRLGEMGLGTAVGSVASVGYTGWATLGGYGPFSASRGLGCDNIVGARLVDAAGAPLEAGAELLKGIRGAGGAFGVITELTVKVYPQQQEMLSSMLAFDSGDLARTWAAYAAGLEALQLAGGDVPRALQLQPVGMDTPAGKAFAVLATWTGADLAAGRAWIGRVAGLLVRDDGGGGGGGHVPCLSQGAAAPAMTPEAFVRANEALVRHGSFGRSYSLNFRRFTPATAQALARGHRRVPPAGCLLSVHMLRAPAEGEGEGQASVFAAREQHHMLELVAITHDETIQAQAEAWAREVIRDLKESDPENILESSYVALVGEGEADYKKIYGQHYDELLALKKKYDPENVFRYAVPRLLG
ncbi:FAD-binding domain-containing protein [Xylariomycetidae sp. FL0641]|nr:FAD-binding domain-containing protein [Xylariomycetidae sp. FL0641]